MDLLKVGTYSELSLVDSHCHLNFPELSNQLDIVLSNAHQNGVKIIQTICTNLAEFTEILALTTKYQEIFCSVGVHPLNIIASAPLASKEEIKNKCSHPKVIGIGETGLDFYRIDEALAKNRQIASFINHIEAAIETNLPIIIHSRNAEKETLEILKAYPKVLGVIHCFTGSRDFAESCLASGFYISASGILTFKNAKDLHSIFEELPLDKILIETDSPYLAPVPYRGQSNQPSYVIEVAKFLANLKNISLEEIAYNTTNNFLQLFNKVKGFIQQP